MNVSSLTLNFQKPLLLSSSSCFDFFDCFDCQVIRVDVAPGNETPQTNPNELQHQTSSNEFHRAVCTYRRTPVFARSYGLHTTVGFEFLVASLCLRLLDWLLHSLGQPRRKSSFLRSILASLVCFSDTKSQSRTEERMNFCPE
jgi:hypothetical protein